MSEQIDQLDSILEAISVQQRQVEELTRLPEFVATTEGEVQALTENMGSLARNMESLTQNMGSLIEGMGSQAQNVRSLTENMGCQARNVRSLIENMDSLGEGMGLLCEQMRTIMETARENERRFEVLRAEAAADRRRTDERFDRMMLAIQTLRLERQE